MPHSIEEDPSSVSPRLRSLTTLAPGDLGRLHAESILPEDRDLLTALGLVDRSTLRLCKAGTPWIVQVRGTRIGLSDDVARRLQVSTDTE